MKLTKRNWIGFIIAAAIIIGDIALMLGSKIFFFLIGIAVVIAALPFFLATITEVGREKEKESMFLEFSRTLVESVRAGIPISRVIINVGGKDFGSLTPHVTKLANQIRLGIPVSQALQIFAKDTRNKVIARSIALITEAEKSGGDIAMILESVAKSVAEIEDLKKERQSSMFNLVMQGYIIFLIFIVIMLVMQIKFIPLIMTTLSAAGGAKATTGFTTMPEQMSVETLNQMFILLIFVQSFFAGLVIGKLSEGNIKAGIKHSFILVTVAILLVTGAGAFFK